MSFIEDLEIERDKPLKEAGFIKFYGLYWKKSDVGWQDPRPKLLGQPKGWMKKGKVATDADRSRFQMNFWQQKGVYILYDANLNPVYAGQAGLKKTAKDGSQNIGNRLLHHSRGVYRNGWSLFSWFGFLETKQIDLRNTDEKFRYNPSWNFESQQNVELNHLLASFEAILIEGFAPRFNARGGDLGKAVIVNQFES
jgi:hypothetical protein